MTDDDYGQDGEIVELARGIMAVVRCELVAGTIRIVQFYGNAFIAAPGVVVTCAHCVPEGDLQPNDFYALVDPLNRKDVPDGGTAILQLRDVTMDQRGYDLATAAVDSSSGPVGKIVTGKLTTVGFRVATWSHPGTVGVFDPTAGQEMWSLAGRYLEGYVTRHILYDRPGARSPEPVWEIDMTSVGGASGAPIVVMTGRRFIGRIAGVIYARYPAFVAPTEGAIVTEPPIWFTLAYDHEVLLGLAGVATRGRPLSEIVGT